MIQHVKRIAERITDGLMSRTSEWILNGTPGVVNDAHRDNEVELVIKLC